MSSLKNILKFVAFVFIATIIFIFFWSVVQISAPKKESKFTILLKGRVSVDPNTSQVKVNMTHLIQAGEDLFLLPDTIKISGQFKNLRPGEFFIPLEKAGENDPIAIAQAIIRVKRQREQLVSQIKQHHLPLPNAGSLTPASPPPPSPSPPK